MPSPISIVAPKLRKLRRACQPSCMPPSDGTRLTLHFVGEAMVAKLALPEMVSVPNVFPGTGGMNCLALRAELTWGLQPLQLKTIENQNFYCRFSTTLKNQRNWRTLFANEKGKGRNPNRFALLWRREMLLYAETSSIHSLYSSSLIFTF